MSLSLSLSFIAAPCLPTSSSTSSQSTLTMAASKPSIRPRPRSAGSSRPPAAPSPANHHHNLLQFARSHKLDLDLSDLSSFERMPKRRRTRTTATPPLSSVGSLSADDALDLATVSYLQLSKAARTHTNKNTNSSTDADSATGTETGARRERTKRGSRRSATASANGTMKRHRTSTSTTSTSTNTTRDTSIDIDINTSIPSDLSEYTSTQPSSLSSIPHGPRPHHERDRLPSPADFDPGSLSSEKAMIAARNRIVVKWLWLVSAIARKMYHSYTQSFPEMRSALCAADLIQEGVCGLMQAVDKWDSGRGYAFDSYAFYSIKHAVIRAVQNQSRPIRLPIHVLDKLSRMRKVAEILRLNDRSVTVDAIAQGAGVSRKAAELYLQRNYSMVSIDAPIGAEKNVKGSAAGGGGGSNSGSVSNHNNSLSHFLVDHSVDVARHVDRSCTREAVAQLVESTDLLELERSVVFLKFGLDDGIERVRAEVSRILDVRVHSVRRAELSALKKLRESIGDDMETWTEMIS